MDIGWIYVFFIALVTQNTQFLVSDSPKLNGTYIKVLHSFVDIF